MKNIADLVIEIVSESDSHLVYREKLPRYREAAIPEVWIVDPLRGEILVERRAQATGECLTVSRGRVESTVVPGFWIKADWLWLDELPPPHECLEEILRS